jgi:hypothetical protein
VIKWPLTNDSLEEVVEPLISELRCPEDFRNLVQARDSGQIVMALNGSVSFVYKAVDSTIIGRMEFRLPPEVLKLLQLAPNRSMALQGNARELARMMKAEVLGIQGDRTSAETKVTITSKCYGQIMRSYVPNAEPCLTLLMMLEETMMP